MTEHSYRRGERQLSCAIPQESLDGVDVEVGAVLR